MSHTLPGVEMIRSERLRQIIEEGFGAGHDEAHNGGQLAFAAMVYADPNGEMFDEYWPWDARWYKPKDRIRNLVRAGALIAAEIDRLLATEGHEKVEGTNTRSSSEGH